PALEEASRSLGYGPVKTFFRVTLPLLKPAIASGALLVALYTLSEFGAVSLLQYETFTWAIYVQYNFAFDRQAASSLALVLTVIALLVVWMERRSRSRGRYYRSSAGTARPYPRVALRRWRWPAFAFVATPLFLGLVAPVGFLVYWLAEGLAQGRAMDVVWTSTVNSFSIAGIAGVVAVLVAAPVAVMAVRFPGKLSALAEQSTYLGFALPGIVVALAIVFLGVNFLPAIYQTRTLLVAAYVLLFLPVAVGALRTLLLQVSPHLEEVARSLGATQGRAMLRITLPLVLPGALAGGAMAFLLTMKELPATLILRPAGFDTLATSIWSAVSEAFFTRGAAAALLLILVAGPPTAYLVLQEHWGSKRRGPSLAHDEELIQ
ncbi:MAG: iron ABC transporter permease, partial [Dehalococcoidia bacterium]